MAEESKPVELTKDEFVKWMKKVDSFVDGHGKKPDDNTKSGEAGTQKVPAPAAVPVKTEDKPPEGGFFDWLKQIW